MRLERWRCIAVHDIKECLIDKQRFRFLPSDARMVLTAMLLPTDGTDVERVLTGADLEEVLSSTR